MEHSRELYTDVEKAIDYAFQGQFVLKFYDYLRVTKAKRIDAEEFNESSTAKEIKDLVNDLNAYLEGGQDNEHKQIREGYGYLPKPQARKIKLYLEDILNDGIRYAEDKKPGRKKKS
tara:strand:- start:417 stop:767 length:351 start_codon:yes stop_codon:yes gene_type:complete